MHLDDRKISASLAMIELKAEDHGAKPRLKVTEQGPFPDGGDDGLSWPSHCRTSPKLID
jgi:hypothetical protein